MCGRRRRDVSCLLRGTTVSCDGHDGLTSVLILRVPLHLPRLRVRDQAAQSRLQYKPHAQLISYHYVHVHRCMTYLVASI